MYRNWATIIFLALLAGCTQEQNVPVTSIDVSNEDELTPEQKKARADAMVAQLVRRYALQKKPAVKQVEKHEVPILRDYEKRSSPREEQAPLGYVKPNKKLEKLKLLQKPVLKKDTEDLPTQKPTHQFDYIWPVKGSVVAHYGRQDDGTHSDGIDIAVGEDKPVKAIQAGDVVYAGHVNDLLGNVTLIQHKKGFISAYANLERNIFRRGQHVLKGQVVGRTAKPVFHFELRKDDQSVDPLKYLPH